MAGNGLFDPLGVDRAEPARGGLRPPPAPAIVLTVGLAAVAALFVVAWLRDDGDRGRPRAVAPIAHVEAPPKPPPAPVAPSAPAPSDPGLPAPQDQDVVVENGVRVIRPRHGLGAAPSAVLPAPGAATAPQGR